MPTTCIEGEWRYRVYWFKTNVVVLCTKVIKRRKTSLPTAFRLSHICCVEGMPAANELPPTSISHRACKQTMKDVSAASNFPDRESTFVTL